MPSKFTKSRKRYNRTGHRSGRKKNPYSKKSKVSKYSRKNKQKFVNRSNPVAENKKVEATEISADVGRNNAGNLILTDYSGGAYGMSHYTGNEPPLNGGTNMPVANLPTGARGFPLRDSVFNFNPDSALYQTQGIDSDSMIGSSCYQKLTAAKFLIRWPQPNMNTGKWNGRTTDMPAVTAPVAERVAWLIDPLNNHMGAIPETPQSYHLYWGFIKTPTGFSSFTTPKKDECTAVQLEQHINRRVEEWFNQRSDRISFIPKVNNDMKIIGKKKLFPPWDHRTGRLAVTNTKTIDGDDVESNIGSIPDTLVKITWPHNRKIHFQETNNFSGDGVDDIGNPNSGSKVFYRNHDWLPFACIVNWNASTLPKNADSSDREAGDPWTEAQVDRDRHVPHVLINDITYYRDS